MPYYTSTDPIADRAIELLQNEGAREVMESELAAIVAPLRDTQASKRTAEMLVEMIKTNQH